MYCYQCEEKITESKIGFHAICPKCGRDLHICKNCRFYQEGKPHDCLIPNIEPINDKEKGNFCEDFSPKISLEKTKKKDITDVSKKLFGDDDPIKKFKL